MILAVGISDLKISDNNEDIIITYSLGSCIGVTLYDPIQCVGGMLHALLPEGELNLKSAEKNPSMFVDTDFQALLDKLLKYGSKKKDLKCKVAGGSSFFGNQDFFKTGEENYSTLRKVLRKNHIMVAGEDVGGSIPRTMVLDITTGNTLIHTKGKEIVL